MLYDSKMIWYTLQELCTKTDFLCLISFLTSSFAPTAECCWRWGAVLPHSRRCNAGTGRPAGPEGWEVAGDLSKQQGERSRASTWGTAVNNSQWAFLRGHSQEQTFWVSSLQPSKSIPANAAFNLLQISAVTGCEYKEMNLAFLDIHHTLFLDEMHWTVKRMPT